MYRTHDRTCKPFALKVARGSFGMQAEAGTKRPEQRRTPLLHWAVVPWLKLFCCARRRLRQSVPSTRDGRLHEAHDRAG